MFPFVWKNSGYLSIFLTWFLVVFPYFFAKRKDRGAALPTFSDAASLPKYKLLMNIVIVSIGFFQIILLTYLARSILLNRIGGGIYLLGSLSLIMCALFNKKSFPLIHFIFTRSYIFSMILALLLIGSVFGVLSSLIVVVMFIGVLILGLSKKYLFAELWLISGLSVWGLLIYFYI